MGAFLGTATNNVAEYAGLALALHLFTPQPNDPPRILRIHADSLLMVKQFNGQFRVKNERLKGWFALVKDLARNVTCTVTHVRRELNKQADRCANEGIDQKIAPPASFTALLSQRGLLP
jgi:ribonuclease HI